MKPHNKTPYELLVGRPPNLDFMRPFECLVTILNTLDHLGKFEGKADEGFLVGYFVNSKPFRLFDIDLLTKSMSYEPVTAGNKTNDDVDMSLLMMLERRMMFSIQQKTMIKMVMRRMLEIKKKLLENNLIKKLKDCAAGQSFDNNDLPTNPLMPDLEVSTGIFRGAYDDEDVGAEADLQNLETTMNVSPIPTTRIHIRHLSFLGHFRIEMHLVL
ncbi:hypothetical protein Tco_0801750 [Tanacetum coccineum]|uniref:Uncharacterized protein n=1 Tax=Tanacetum coccineum TaxID=301880 RepID=A0ABQ5A122_9ASTR